MSLILEALRKSEAERRRGQVPTLYAEVAHTPSANQRNARWPWVIAALAIILAGLAWWRTLPTAPVAHAPSIQSEPSAEINVNAAPRFQAEQIETPAQRLASSQHSTIEHVAAAQISVPAPSAAIDTPTDTPIAGEKISNVNPTESTEPTIAAVQPSAPADSSTTTTTSAPESQPATPAIDAVADQESSLLSVNDLDANTRAQLPALKLSMHVWNDQPPQRFVIVDGQRLREGDRVGEAVIERITREGLILVWNERRLRLVRP